MNSIADVGCKVALVAALCEIEDKTVGNGLPCPPPTAASSVIFYDGSRRTLRPGFTATVPKMLNQIAPSQPRHHATEADRQQTPPKIRQFAAELRNPAFRYPKPLRRLAGAVAEGQRFGDSQIAVADAPELPACR